MASGPRRLGSAWTEPGTLRLSPEFLAGSLAYLRVTDAGLGATMGSDMILEYPSKHFESLFISLVNQRREFWIVVRGDHKEKEIIKHKVSLLIDKDHLPFSAAREMYTTLSLIDFSSCLGLIIGDGGYGISYEDEDDLRIRFCPLSSNP